MDLLVDKRILTKILNSVFNKLAIERKQNKLIAINFKSNNNVITKFKNYNSILRSKEMSALWRLNNFQ
jgi:hypothetical protein